MGKVAHCVHVDESVTQMLLYMLEPVTRLILLLYERFPHVSLSSIVDNHNVLAFAATKCLHPTFSPSVLVTFVSQTLRR